MTRINPRQIELVTEMVEGALSSDQYLQAALGARTPEEFLEIRLELADLREKLKGIPKDKS